MHRRFRQAREDFRKALRQVVAFYHPGAGDLDAVCARLLDLLGGRVRESAECGDERAPPPEPGSWRVPELAGTVTLRAQCRR